MKMNPCPWFSFRVYRNENLFLLVIMTAIFYSAAVAFNAASPLTYLSLGADQRYVGLPIMIFMIASSLSSFLAGRLMDKLGRKVIISSGFLIGCVGFILVLTALRIKATPLYFLGIFVAGISSGVLLLIRLMAAESLPKGMEGKSVGVVLMGAVIAGVIAPWMFSLLTTTADGTKSLAQAWFYSSLLLSLGLLLSLFLKSTDARLSQGAETLSSQKPSIRNVFFIVLCGSANHGLMVAMMSMCSVLMNHHNESADSIYRVIGLHFIGMFLFSLVWGNLADRIGSTALILVGWMITLISSISLLSLHDTLGYFIAMFFLGIGWSMVFVSMTVKMAKELPASMRGKYTGLHDFWATLIGAVLSIVLGYAMYDEKIH